MLIRCLYASRAAKPLAETALNDILRQSRKNNPAMGITGMLCFTQELFVQVIEGGRDEVNRLLNSIIRDERNIDVQILSFEEIAERSFNNWTMGQVDLATVNPSLLLKYSERPELNPFACSARATMALLLDLASSGAIGARFK
jgi:hypothetical protein